MTIPKFRSLILSVFALIGVALVLVSEVQASSASDKSEIVARFQSLIAAYGHGDVNAIMAFYSDDPGAIFFEDTIPFQVDKAALRNGLEVFYKTISDFRARVESLDVQTSGDLAVVHCAIHNTWNDKNGAHMQTSRDTDVFRKEDGKWLIWHEHFSVPFDPATGKAALNAKP
jgi:ketosteroid isomerase-like protein